MIKENIKKKREISALGFFKYFRKLTGLKVYIYILLNIFVGLLDGIGLTMFVPLLYIAADIDSTSPNASNFNYLTDFLDKINLELSLETVLILMILVFTFKGLFSYIKTILFIQIQQDSIRKIRFKLVDSLKNLLYYKFTKVDAGIIQNNMTTETTRLVQSLILYFNSLQSVLMLLTYLALAFITNWQFSILVVIGGATTHLIYKYLNKITKTQAKKLSTIGRNFQAYLIQSIHNFKYLKATNYFENYEKKLKKEIIDSESTQFHLGKISAFSDNIREPLTITIIAVVTIVQVRVWNASVTSIFATLLLFYRSLGYLASMQGFWNKFLSNIPGLESVEEMLTDFGRHSDKTGGNEVEKIDFINLEKVSLSYDKTEVLSDINLNIKKNTSIGLIGESGAGKTTLANVICGLIEPSKGKVYYSKNKKLKEANIGSFRKKVGYITQEPVIFDDTLFNNVTFWHEKNTKTLEKFWKTMDLVSLKDFVEELELKENTPLGNTGILISGGQKQRISIARELYKDVDLLIMDEATSALDSETEKYIKDKIDLLHGRFTMVIVAHRLSTIKNVDTIYLMDKGKVIDYGSFNELLEKSEKFKQMVKLQGMNKINI